ncbi:hypothetical protein NN561_002844 [Cricetulus griseus]
MAASRGVPPMRVLEEALGISFSPTDDTAETGAASAGDGAYYLERILLVTDGACAGAAPGGACGPPHLMQ